MTAFLLAAVLLAPPKQEPDPDALKAKVLELVQQLESNDVPTQKHAEDALLELGDDGLNVLTNVNLTGLSDSTRTAIQRVRAALVAKQVAAVMRPTKVTLQGTMSVGEALESLSQQSNIQIIGVDDVNQDLKLDLNDVEFWRGLDAVMQPAHLQLYPYGTEKGELRLVSVKTEQSHQSAPVCYSGPFRIAVSRCESTADFQNPSVDQTVLVLDIQWEPRMTLIALNQDMNAMKVVVGDDDHDIRPKSEEAFIEASVQPEIPQTELPIAFELPPRTIEKINRFSGTMNAIVAGQPETFYFKGLDPNASNLEVRKGAVTLVLVGWEEMDKIYSVNLQLKINNDEALESFRSWPLNNEIYIDDGMGTHHEPVGMELTQQSEGVVAFRYLFSQDPTGTTLVYKAPTSITAVPIKFDFRNIILP